MSARKESREEQQPTIPEKTEPSASASLNTCVFKRAVRRPGAASNSRQRSVAKEPAGSSSSSSSSSSEDADKAVKSVKRTRRGSRKGLTAKSSSGGSAKKFRKGASSSSSGSEEERDHVGVRFSGSGLAKAGPSDQGATAVNEAETELDRDARAVQERAAKANEDRKTGPDGAVDFEDRVYKGLNNYAKFIEKRDTAFGSAFKSSTGPQRAPAHLRATVRWDYAPDICKDYKETGFCGFGDSCKFMHDRSDYKFGWQLERDMASGTYGKEDDEDVNKYKVDSSDDEEKLPFKCYLCRQSFKDPVVTRCKHYFCEKCALGHYKKSQRCFACGAQTNGVFNPAKNVIDKMEKNQQVDAIDNACEAGNEDDSD